MRKFVGVLGGARLFGWVPVEVTTLETEAPVEIAIEAPLMGEGDAVPLGKPVLSMASDYQRLTPVEGPKEGAGNIFLNQQLTIGGITDFAAFIEVVLCIVDGAPPERVELCVMTSSKANPPDADDTGPDAWGYAGTHTLVPAGVRDTTVGQVGNCAVIPVRGAAQLAVYSEVIGGDKTTNVSLRIMAISGNVVSTRILG